MIYGEILGNFQLFDPGFDRLLSGGWSPEVLTIITAMASTSLFNVLKGKYGIALLVFTVPAVGLILSCVGAVRLAKPRSYWARYLYDQDLMAKAIERHEPPIDLEKYPKPKQRKGYSAPQPPAASTD